MKGEAQPLIKFFDGSDKRFIIPLYQRNYDWKEENCKQLFQDLIKLHTTGRKRHFFGSIVSSIKDGSEDRYIIDGQQRITTVSLLLIALVNAAKKSLIACDDPKNIDKIYKKYIVDEFQEDERKVKLKPIKKDMEAFDSLLYKSEDQYIKESNVTRNYNFLYEEIIKCKLTIEDLFESIKKLEIINIHLDSDDNPQLIFESLNSTGLDLSEADKIRNYLLMSLTPEVQDEFYTKYWNKIEECTQYEPTSFVRDYLTIKTGKIGRIDKIYFIFKEYTELENIDKEDLFIDMLHYAEIYKQLNTAQFGTDKLKTKFSQLRILDSTITYPFFMSFLDYAFKNDLSENDVYNVCHIVETYISRRIICNIPSNALSTVFATLHREVVNTISKEKEGNIPTYLDALTYNILKKERSSRFPKDKEVETNFATRQIYKIPTAARVFIMERMENRDSNERHDVVKGIEAGKITIEHIMPQTLSKEWKISLGEDWERIHQQYLHTMANLTLTGYNSKYSNNIFNEKKNIENGFNDSAFRLNNFLKQCDKWGEEELIKRQKELLDVFKKLWSMPTTCFKPTKLEGEMVALDEDDFDFTGKKLRAYFFRGTRYAVDSWKDMIIQMCGHILQEKHSTIEWLCAKEDINYVFNANSEALEEFAPSMYVWAHNSTNTKINILSKLFLECNIPESELVFEFFQNED